MMNIIRNRINGVVLLLGATMLIAAGCQRESLAPESDALYDGIVKFAPSVGGIVTGVKSSVTGTAPAATRTQSLTLTSEDGTYTLPMSLSVTSMEGGMATKATLINDPGTATGSVLPLGNFATSIDNTFWVTAWDNAATSSRIIPDATAKAFTGGYVAGSDANGWYQKVMYRDGASSSKYWMTVQPYTPAGGSATIADDEYIWKKIDTDHAETKTFFAYANLPSIGATVTNTEVANQVLTLTSLPDKDILLGYYSGNGYSGDPSVMTGTAGIRFYHPLTAVKFKKGTLSEGVTITGISVNGIYTSGQTTQTAATGTNFGWTKTGGSAFAAADETGAASLSSVTVDDDSFIGEAIVLIPETFASDKARIAVTLDTPTGAKTVYYPLKGMTFEAGFTNVFTIGYENDYLDVNLNQTVVSGVARSLGVRNSGNDNAYIRLAVTSCWADDGGNIIKGYTDFTAGGTATGLNTTDWAKGTDGFYYYKKAIGPGKTTKALFTSFEPGEAPAEGLTFEMMVSVQAVGGSYAEGKNLSDNAKTAWGSSIPVTDAIEE